MAVREIKTRIELDGEKKFKQALADAGREMRVMDSELKKLASEFNTSGDAQTYYTNKSRVLKNEVSQQKQIVAALEKAIEDSAKAYGSASAQTDGYRIKLNHAYSKLAQMEKQLKDTEREARDFGRSSSRIGRQIKDGIGDAAEDASMSLRDMMDQLSGDVGSIRNMASIQIATEVGGGVINAVQNVVSFVENSRDYRTRMARTRQSIESAGYVWEEMQGLLFETAAMTGDIDGAQEGVANLARLNMGDEWVKTATDLLGGAAILWQDTLNFENLASDLQESVASGEATGQYAELLARLGIKLETYKESMEGLDEFERANASLSWLSGKGILEARAEYEKNNAQLIEAQLAQIELTQAWAELAEKFEPVVTDITELITNAVESATEWIGKLNDLKKMLSGKEGALEVTKEYDPTFGNAIESGQLDTAIGTMEYVWDQAKKNLFKSVEVVAEEDAKAYQDAFDQAMDVWVPNINEAWDAYNEGGGQAVMDLLNRAMISEEEKQQLIQNLQNMGMDLSGAFDSSLQTGLGAAAENAKTSGANIPTAFDNGVNSTAQVALDALDDLSAQINARLQAMSTAAYGTIPIYGAAGGGFTTQRTTTPTINLTANVTLDGQKVGQLTAGSVNQRLGAQAARNTRLL